MTSFFSTLNNRYVYIINILALSHCLGLTTNYSVLRTTSNPGPFDIEAAREKALVKSGHVTPQILDIA